MENVFLKHAYKAGGNHPPLPSYPPRRFESCPFRHNHPSLTTMSLVPEFFVATKDIKAVSVKTGLVVILKQGHLYDLSQYCSLGRVDAWVEGEPLKRPISFNGNEGFGDRP